MKQNKNILGRLLIVLLSFSLFAGNALAAVGDCCLTLPAYPGNEADSLVRGSLGVAPFDRGQAPEHSRFIVDILAAGGTLGSPTPPIKPGSYAAWCFDPATYIGTGSFVDGTGNTVGVNYGGFLFSSCSPDPDAVDGVNSYLPNRPGVKQPAAIWKKVNYLINHRFENCGTRPPTMFEVQNAIFKLFGNATSVSPPAPPFDINMVDCLIAKATANAPGWTPQNGDKIAVIYVIDLAFSDDVWVNPVQLLFLEVPCEVPPPTPPVCEVTGSARICKGESQDMSVSVNGGTAPYSYSWTGPNGFTSTNATITVTNAGTYEVTVTDSSSPLQTTTCAAILEVTDGIPVFENCPQDLNLGCNPDPLTIPNCNQPFPVTAKDNHGSVLVSCSGVTDVSEGCMRIRTLTYTAVNECGTATCVQKITWKEDKTKPTIVCPPNIGVQCLSDIPPVNLNAVTATDDCGTPTKSLVSETYTTNSCKITVVRTFQAVDACGNTATCSQTITVQDTLRPVITCPPDITITNSVSKCSDKWCDHKSCGDKCSDRYCDHKSCKSGCNKHKSCKNDDWSKSNVSNLLAFLSNYFNGYNSCVASSGSGSNADVSPTKTGFATATDNCDSQPVITYSDVVTPGECDGNYKIVRTWVATDKCGNSTSCKQNIYVGGDSKGSICGQVFADCDGTGDLTKRDAGLSNVVVTLKNGNGTVVATTKTDKDGKYCFDDLNSGTFSVVVTPPDGYQQTAGSTKPQWKDNNGQTCWKDRDGNDRWRDRDGKECWKDKDGNNHWKDDDGYDCWKDKYGKTYRQKCSHTNCSSPKNNTEIVKLSVCEPETDINFAYTGTKPKCVVTVSAPSKGKCGDTITYTITVKNTGNACYKSGSKVKVFDKYYDCPSLGKDESYSFEVKYKSKSSDYGDFKCNVVVDYYSYLGSKYTAQGSCITKMSR